MGQSLGPQTPNISSVEQGQKNDGVTWWCRLLARTTCVVAGINDELLKSMRKSFLASGKVRWASLPSFVGDNKFIQLYILRKESGYSWGIAATITGLFRLLTFTPLCLVAGILLMLLGFAAIVLEAPCCCQFLDFIQPISKFSEKRSYWQKAAMYTLPAFVPPILCFSMTTACGSALLIASGVIHGLIALGRKADKETMMNRAKGEDMEMKETLIANDQTIDSSSLKP